MKKDFLLSKIILCIVIMTCAVNGTMVAQDTLCFHFDQNSKRLTVYMEGGSTTLQPCFKMRQNDFSQKFRNTLPRDILKFPRYSDSIYGAIFKDPTQKRMTIEDVDWFDVEKDSAECAQLDVRMWNGSNELEIATAKRCPVKVGIVHGAPGAGAMDGNDGTDPVEGQAIQVATGRNLPIVLVIVVGAVVAGAVLCLLLSKRKKNPKNKKNTSVTGQHSNDSSVEVVEEVSGGLINGLDAVAQAENAYYTMDMQKDFKDTAIHKIYIHHTAVKKMYDFFKASLESSDQTTETGCYFVGCWEYATEDKQTYNISVEDIVEPGDDIVSGEFSFNFGLKIGIKLYAKIGDLTKKTHRDFVQTVWMHSHPGLGLFLSSHDLLVQQQLTYQDAPKRLVAFVVDTNTPNLDLAVFTAKADGTMNNKEELTRLYSLEELYKWSRSAYQATGDTHPAITDEVEEKKDTENYYTYPMQVNHQGTTRTRNIYFSGKSINAIDDIMYECAGAGSQGGRKTIGGYVYGETDKTGNIMIDDCQKSNDGNPLGIIIADELAERVDEYVKGLPVICVLVCRSNDELVVLTRDNATELFQTVNDVPVLPTKLMKEWLRRRRIYK